MSAFAKILLPLPFDKGFDYAVPEGKSYNVGELVKVPFGKKELYGVITELSDSADIKDKSKIKSVIASAREGGFEMPDISPALMKLVNWQAAYTLEQKGRVLGLIYNSKYFTEVKARKVKAVAATEPVVPQLNTEQAKAAENTVAREKGFSVTLLEGITGSGKTETYFELVDKVMKSGRQVLIMLPEILLTAQMITRFTRRFGFEPVMWHSTMGEAAKRRAFYDVANGRAKAVVGARSSLHLPYKDLGLVIVDEEHDSSYKQEDQVIYNARDIAVMRGKLEDIPVILSTATPSVESYHNAVSGRYFHEALTQRFNDAQLPDVDLIDMREEELAATEFISPRLRMAVTDRLENNKQVMLFLNRRGYAPLTLCGKCGFRFKSPDTSAWMVMHMVNGKPYLKCHHTGHSIPLPEICPGCNAKESFRACGPGVQRLAEEVRRLWPNARVLELASDTATSPKKMDEMIRSVEQHEVDIIIGTQIIAKGHNFPALSLVGIVDGDLGLDVADLRATEKSFQLLHQVSGRAGRIGQKGLVMVQTFLSDNPVMQALKRNDATAFMQQELNIRQQAGLPPFAKLCAVTVSAKTDGAAMKAARQLAAKFPRASEVKLYGPAPAAYHEYKGSFRYRLVARTDKKYDIQNYVRSALSNFEPENGVKVRVDIDPYNFG